MDAGTIYANVMRTMNATSGGQNQWKLVSIVCFAEPSIDGRYLNESEYALLYRLAPNIQAAFEAVDAAIADARKSLKKRIEKSRC